MIKEIEKRKREMNMSDKESYERRDEARRERQLIKTSGRQRGCVGGILINLDVKK